MLPLPTINFSVTFVLFRLSPASHFMPTIPPPTSSPSTSGKVLRDVVGVDHDKLNDAMTSRLCPSPTSCPPPPSILELAVDHQGMDQGRPPLCAGCRLRIVDKFYLCAVEAKWHSSCLKCSDCGVELANQLSCFERDGNIYCKDDYIRSVNCFH